MNHWGGRGSPEHELGGDETDHTPVPYYYLGVIQQGVFRLTIDGEAKRSPPGSGFIISPGSNWSSRPPKDGSVQLICFTIRATRMVPETPEGKTVKPAPGEPPQPRPEDWWGVPIGPHLPVDLCDLIAADVRFISDIWWRDALGHYRANTILANLLERLVVRACTQERQSTTWERIAHPGVRAAMERAQANPRVCRQVSDLAKLAGMERTAFSLRFREEVGLPPGQWLREMRLQTAERHLVTSDRTIQSIAEDLGFTDPTALARQFSRHYGCSPRSWRRQSK